MVGGNTREACGNGGKKAARHERAGAGRGWIPQEERQGQFKSEILASGNTRGSCQWQHKRFLPVATKDNQVAIEIGHIDHWQQ